MGVLPSCQLTLECSKPTSCAYPGELKTIGDHIRKRRLDLGLLQVSIGQRIGVCCSTVGNWEKGRAVSHLRHMPAIIAVQGYDPTPVGGSLGERLARFRRIRGWTQVELARKLGVNLTTLARWERDERKPSGEYRARVDGALDDAEGAVNGRDIP